AVFGVGGGGVGGWGQAFGLRPSARSVVSGPSPLALPLAAACRRPSSVVGELTFLRRSSFRAFAFAFGSGRGSSPSSREGSAAGRFGRPGGWRRSPPGE